jgi:hypothetical protein
MASPTQIVAKIRSGYRTWQVASTAFVVLALGVAIFWGARGGADIPAGSGHAVNKGEDDLAERLAAIEERQARQDELINRQLRVLSKLAGQGSLNPEQALRKEQRRAHVRRMQQDPAYARQVQEQRLSELQHKFAEEPVNQRWAAETRAMTGDAIVSSAAMAGAKVKDADVDCRSKSCRIAFAVDAKFAYDDVLTYLMTDLAETLPSAQLVVMPLENGERKVNIFASNEVDSLRNGRD